MASGWSCGSDQKISARTWNGGREFRIWSCERRRGPARCRRALDDEAHWPTVAIRQRIAEERLDLGGRRDEGRDRTTAGGGRCPPPTPTLRRLDGVRPGHWRIVVERP